MSVWLTVSCTDDRLRGLYLRHYSASKATRRRGRPIDHPNQLRFVGPGEYMGLLTADCGSGFVWRLSRYRKDGQHGVECVLFRNELGNGCRNQAHAHCSSRQIREACELAWLRWPGKRLFTFVDRDQVQSSNPGYCFLAAGWRRAGESKRGLLVFEVEPAS